MVTRVRPTPLRQFNYSLSPRTRFHPTLDDADDKEISKVLKEINYAIKQAYLNGVRMREVSCRCARN